MSVPDTAAQRLHALYVDELVQSLMPPVRPMVDTRQTQALIRHARATGPGLCEAPDETTWIWSDLPGTQGVTRGLLQAVRHGALGGPGDDGAWYDLVGADETIICLGDVSVDGSVQAHHQRWWREAPGVKWLVLGNHDFTRFRWRERPLGVDASVMTLVIHADPPLLVTHVPLVVVPDGCVNVHGHHHDFRPLETGRWINVSVEQTGYRPLDVRTQVLPLARALAAGRVPERATTLDHIRRAGLAN